MISAAPEILPGFAGEGDRPQGGGGATRAATVKRARRLRRDLSPPEVLLWQALRQRPTGLKFRRQHPLAPYVLDFYCAEAGLAIEIDGWVHSAGDRPIRDARRDAWLAAQGVTTLRIAASEVTGDMPGAVERIVAAARSLPLHHRKGDGPPPRQSRGGN